MQGLGKWVAQWFNCPQAAPAHWHTSWARTHPTRMGVELPNCPQASTSSHHISTYNTNPAKTPFSFHSFIPAAYASNPSHPQPPDLRRSEDPTAPHTPQETTFTTLIMSNEVSTNPQRNPKFTPKLSQPPSKAPTRFKAPPHIAIFAYPHSPPHQTSTTWHNTTEQIWDTSNSLSSDILATTKDGPESSWPLRHPKSQACADIPRIGPVS